MLNRRDLTNGLVRSAKLGKPYIPIRLVMISCYNFCNDIDVGQSTLLSVTYIIVTHLDLATIARSRYSSGSCYDCRYDINVLLHVLRHATFLHFEP